MIHKAILTIIITDAELILYKKMKENKRITLRKGRGSHENCESFIALSEYSEGHGMKRKYKQGINCIHCTYIYTKSFNVV